jgi:hypothetical protein
VSEIGCERPEPSTVLKHALRESSTAAFQHAATSNEGFVLCKYTAYIDIFKLNYASFYDYSPFKASGAMSFAVGGTAINCAYLSLPALFLTLNSTLSASVYLPGIVPCCKFIAIPLKMPRAYLMEYSNNTAF